MIPVARPWLGEAEAEAARRAILSGWVTQGPEVEAFEREFAAYVSAPHACAVSSGTAALHLALVAVGVGPGDEVVTVSHSFIATANAIRYCGATPVFVDIDPATYNIHPDLAERAITPRTKAILCVHQMGMPCDLAALVPIAQRHGVALVEDAACAVGSEIAWNGAWERIGRPRSDVACFSLHPRKLITTGEGGLLTTARADLDAQFRLLRQHGMTMSDRSRHVARDVVVEQYAGIGYNYRLSDVQAAIGREQLKRLPDAIARRRALAARYAALVGDCPVTLPAEPRWARSNFQSYCVRLPPGCDQRDVMQQMREAGVSTRRGIMCAHREPAYREGGWSCGAPRPGDEPCRPGTCARLAESERAQDSCVLLPLFHELTDAEQDQVVNSLREACASACGRREPRRRRPPARRGGAPRAVKDAAGGRR